MCDSDRSPDPDAAGPPPTGQPAFRQQAPKVLQQFKDQLALLKVGNVEIVEQYPFPYFHHFPKEAISAGLPWDLVDMQGTSKTWYLGASTCFESVHDVTYYNLMILDKYLGVNLAGPHAKAAQQGSQPRPPAPAPAPWNPLEGQWIPPNPFGAAGEGPFGAAGAAGEEGAGKKDDDDGMSIGGVVGIALGALVAGLLGGALFAKKAANKGGGQPAGLGDRQISAEVPLQQGEVQAA